jgi:hypothetical protein
MNLLGPNAKMIGSMVNNSGTLRGQGRITNPITNDGVIRPESGTLTLTNASSLNTAMGRIEAGAGAQIIFAAGLATNSGQIALTGGAFDNNAKAITNSGVINGYGTIRTGVLTIPSGGLLSVGGGDMNVLGAVTNNGIVNIQNGRAAHFFNDVSGSGDYTGTGTAVYLDSFSPGNSAASVSFAGDVSLVGGASLKMEFGGNTPGIQFDRIQVAGQIAVGGMLQVVLINGFAPTPGSSFDILDWGNIVGTFSSLQLPALATGVWNTSQLYTTGLLSIESAGLAGDFNNDNIVDAADYVVWRKGLGTTYTQDHFNIWRANFGQTAGGDSGSGAEGTVPEPASLSLITLGMLAMFTRQRWAKS